MAEEGAPVSPPRASFDDSPFSTEGLPPEIRAPLAPYAGAVPPAPEWFTEAVAQAPERSFTATPRGRIETLTWGEVGQPGLLFVHGNSAHADWWSFIAPYFAGRYRVAAMSLAGMGESDWRERYSFPDFAEDAEAVAQAAGLYAGGRKPLYIGHSFGGAQVFYVAARNPEQLSAAILVDVGFGGPPPAALAERQKRMEEIRQLPPEKRPSRVYPDLAAALARFRLMPPQPAANHYILDFIARRSLREVEQADGGAGWTWKFDPEMWDKLDRRVMAQFDREPHAVSVPLSHIYGDHSAILARSRGEGPLSAETLSVEVPDSEHHVMIDQPLALVAAIRAVLAGWGV